MDSSTVIGHVPSLVSLDGEHNRHPERFVAPAGAAVQESPQSGGVNSNHGRELGPRYISLFHPIYNRATVHSQECNTTASTWQAESCKLKSSISGRNVNSLSEVLSTNLLRIRKARGFSQESLGKAVGVSRNTINRYESGQGGATFETIAKLAAVLDVPETDLLNPALCRPL